MVRRHVETRQESPRSFYEVVGEPGVSAQQHCPVVTWVAVLSHPRSACASVLSSDSRTACTGKHRFFADRFKS